MEKFEYIKDDGINKISLKSIVEYVVRDAEVKDVSVEPSWFAGIGEFTIATEEQENTPEIEKYGDFMYGLKFKDDESIQIVDRYYAVPAMSFILFQWLHFAKEKESYNETKRIWEVLHAITYDRNIFNLPK